MGALSLHVPGALLFPVSHERIVFKFSVWLGLHYLELSTSWGWSPLHEHTGTHTVLCIPGLAGSMDLVFPLVKGRATARARVHVHFIT